MKLKFAFAGFRHYHIFELVEALKDHEQAEIVATCEEDGAAREAVARDKGLEVTHESIEKMLAEVECDVVAIGDYYGKRGQIAIQALEAGKHVIADKPLCTSLEELDRIETLAGQKKLVVGCQLNMRFDGAIRTIGKLVADGRIGEVHTIAFGGQHPLMYGSGRPAWYFMPGCQGGTINDIFIHAASVLETVTGRRVVETVAARAWNARLPEVPHFQDAAQLMLRLDNGGGVLGDVSYLAPAQCGYSIDQYWRYTLHGEAGLIEATVGRDRLFLATDQSEKPEQVSSEKGRPLGYFEDFLAQIRGDGDVSLTSQQVIRATRMALQVQRAADENRRDDKLEL
jgi:predicted dehydrogenase